MVRLNPNTSWVEQPEERGSLHPPCVEVIAPAIEIETNFGVVKKWLPKKKEALVLANGAKTPVSLSANSLEAVCNKGRRAMKAVRFHEWLFEVDPNLVRIALSKVKVIVVATKLEPIATFLLVEPA